MKSVYDSERLATGYAFDRPPVHEQILRFVPVAGKATRGLDVGCGAGRSTAALGTRAETVIGPERAAAMLTHCRVVAPTARFVLGSAERLPFADGTFDLVAAAGSLNYVDLSMFLPEVARVLTPDGVLAIYDFSDGKRTRGDDRLATWFSSFERRYPSPPGYENLVVQDIPFDAFSLRLDIFEQLEISLPMSLDAYMRYALSDANVDSAISNGVPEAEIRRWCRETLTEIFGNREVEVVFESYIACVRPDRTSPPSDGAKSPQPREIFFGQSARPDS